MIACAADAGLLLQAFSFEFPAATTTVTPVATRLARAVFTACTAGPPRLALRTYLADGLALLRFANSSMAAANHDNCPDPLVNRTLKSTTVAPLATP